MMSEALERSIVAKDPGAPDLAGRLGAAAGPAILRTASNPEWEVRALALECLDAAGVPDRDRAFLRALRDDDINVRQTAVHYLERCAEKDDVPDLFAEMRENRDAEVREHAALLIGRLGDGAVLTDLATRRTVEEDAAVKTAIDLAMARLGSEEGRARLRKGLSSPDVAVRLETVRSYEYVGDPTALVDLAAAVEDHADALNIRPSNAPRYYLRICDVAVGIVVAVGDPKLGFDGTERRRFSPEELREVAAWLAGARK